MFFAQAPVPQIPSTTDILAGKIQARIAEFFALKDQLNTLSFSSNIVTRAKAQELLVSQTALENEWNININPMVIGLRQGNWAVTDIPTIALFSSKMENQISAVHRLQDQNRGIASTTPGLSLPVKIGIGGTVVVAVLAGIVFFTFFGRRRLA